MNILLNLACLLVAVIAHATYVYFRRRNSFLRKLQGPESTSIFLGDYLDFIPIRVQLLMHNYRERG